MIPSDDVVAVHAVLVPTSNGDGEILMVGGDNHDAAASQAGTWDHSARFNCRNPTQAIVAVQSPPSDLFCCGHATLGDGRVLYAGGTITFPPESHGIHEGVHFEGERRAFAYNPSTHAFGAVATMGFEPGESDGGGRWYPTLCALASGEILAVGGHPDGNDSRHNNNRPERYQPLTDQWVLLQAISDPYPDPDLYPRLHLLRDGSVFVSSKLMGATQCAAIDPWSGAKRDVCPLPDGAYHGFNCPSVLLPLTPEDGYRPRVLLCGGVTSQVIDLGNLAPGSPPQWTTVPRDTAADRGHSCATILPTGDVLLTGGAVANDQSGIFTPELYSTPFDDVSPTPSYSGGPGAWATINDPATVMRNYHSSALLMPDGRVWTAGGNSPTQPNTPPGADQKKIEIFTPPYPAGARPTITSSPPVVAYGDEFLVQTPNAAQIRHVTLMRCGASTHAFDCEQRCVFLSFEVDGGALRVTAPPGGTVAPPGNYMLFLVDVGGRPCEYASFVRIGGHMSLFTDRSTFSEHEVQALLSGADHGVADAVFVVLDGFSQADTTSLPGRPFPPQVTLEFEDDSTAVPGMTVVAMPSSVLFESPSAPANVTQRITVGYRVEFSSAAAFAGIADGDGRAVRVTAQWGPSRATGRLMLYRREHVYALDGATPWLSIDAQVLTLSRGSDSFAGVADNDPATFIGPAIAALRTTPEGPGHPFEQLVAQPNPNLELAPTAGGHTRDNFAFARVRFRAPVGVQATDVKVLFRMFTTAATALTYDETTVYPRQGNGANAIALSGVVNGEVISQPFYAGPRSANPATQQDGANHDTLDGDGATEVTSYFGAWLDFNHDQTIRNRIRGEHQCLVAELHYVPSPIAQGATPADNDQLSQRNLAIVESDNPGDAAAHTVAHTFDLEPSQTPLPKTPLLAMTPWALATHGEMTHGVDKRQFAPPDELLLRWHGLPADSLVQLYLPDVDVAEALRYAAATRPGYGSLRAVDDHTIACRVGDATYLPLPGGRDTNIAGLLTIQLPATVITGQYYRVTAHQIGGRDRAIRASFELSIPVSTASEMLPLAQRRFAVLSEIGTTIESGSRWRPVFDRYLKVLGRRLVSVGGKPDTPGDGGHDHGHPGPGRPGHHGTHVVGKVVETLYDCFGDFIGFRLDCCGSFHDFRAREDRIARIVELAAGQRLLVTVEPVADDPRRAERISLTFR